jgi:hypothetical protein
VLLKTHLRRERNSTLKPRKIAEAKKLGLPIACEACGFDFSRTYGLRGTDYIECHHRTPLHVTGPVKTKTKDLAHLLELPPHDSQSCTVADRRATAGPRPRSARSTSAAVPGLALRHTYASHRRSSSGKGESVSYTSIHSIEEL